MPKLSDLLAEKAKADIQIGGSTVSITFYAIWRERFTDDDWSALLALKGRPYLKSILPRIVLSWDVLNDSGEHIPITADAFDQYEIPDELLLAIEERATGSDLAGKARTSNNLRVT